MVQASVFFYEEFDLILSRDLIYTTQIFVARRRLKQNSLVLDKIGDLVFFAGFFKVFLQRIWFDR
jgi:hypothetical protein